MQPVFAGEYSRFAEARVGAGRLRTVLRTRDVLSSGAVLAAGTDYPASDTGDPIATLDALVTRRGFDGKPADGWLPAQRVEVDAALRAMTIAPAFAAFEEGEGGILAVGRRADLTVLSGDPFATPPHRLAQLTVRQTIVGGRTVYRAHGAGDVKGDVNGYAKGGVAGRRRTTRQAASRTAPSICSTAARSSWCSYGLPRKRRGTDDGQAEGSGASR